MNQPVCAVFDKKTGFYTQPFHVVHTGEAIREWSVVIKDDKTKFGKNPEDFDLYHIGSYDLRSGKYENLPHPTILASGI